MPTSKSRHSSKELPRLRGMIIRAQSGYFTVKINNKSLACQLRGRLKKTTWQGDLAAIGDRVVVTPLDEGRGMIEEVETRQRTISRMAPSPKGEYRQILIANPSQAVFVFSCEQPKPRLRMLDRFLVIAEKQKVPAIIVANKIDLVGVQNAQEVFGHYLSIGYPVIYTSAKTKHGVAELGQRLRGELSMLAGPSGAGKSSLLNAIQPGLGLKVRQVSQATGKGQHTTAVAELFPLNGGGYVADTPGLKALALWDTEVEELDGYFPELRPLVADCLFSDCTHIHEPGCAVIAAVEQGSVHPERYESYVRLRQGDEEN